MFFVHSSFRNCWLLGHDCWLGPQLLDWAVSMLPVGLLFHLRDYNYNLTITSGYY